MVAGVTMGKKLNCWEFMKCGRGSGGNKVEKIGLCPAAVEQRLNGMNGGKNGGRACWVVARTRCNSEAQGTISNKIATCGGCNFYNFVQKEEYPDVVSITNLLSKLNKKPDSPINPEKK